MQHEATRLERLEREVADLRRQARRARHLAAAGLGLAALAWLAAAAPARADEVEATRFLLKDTRGRVRGEWSAGTDSVQLDLRDPRGKTLLGLRLEDEGATSLRLEERRNDRGAAEITVGKDGSALLQLRSSGGLGGAFLSAEPGGAPRLNLLAQGGQPAVRAGVDREGDPGLWLFDGDARQRMRVALVEDGTPVIDCTDHLGKTVFAAP